MRWDRLGSRLKGQLFVVARNTCRKIQIHRRIMRVMMIFVVVTHRGRREERIWTRERDQTTFNSNRFPYLVSWYFRVRVDRIAAMVEIRSSTDRWYFPGFDSEGYRSSTLIVSRACHERLPVVNEAHRQNISLRRKRVKDRYRRLVLTWYTFVVEGIDADIISTIVKRIRTVIHWFQLVLIGQIWPTPKTRIDHHRIGLRRRVHRRVQWTRRRSDRSKRSLFEWDLTEESWHISCANPCAEWLVPIHRSIPVVSSSLVSWSDFESVSPYVPDGLMMTTTKAVSYHSVWPDCERIDRQIVAPQARANAFWSANETTMSMD